MNRFSARSLDILKKSEKGSVMVVFTAALTVMLGFSSLVIDYGFPVFEERKMQNAADSAALAAAQSLPVSISDAVAINNVKNIAYDYAAKNGYSDPSAVNVTLSQISNGQYTKVKVDIAENVKYAFSFFHNQDSVDLNKTASMQLKALSGVKNAIPLSIDKSVMEACLSSGDYHMTLKFGGGSGSNGAYGALDFTGGGASNYEEHLKKGFNEIISVGDHVETENGNMSGPTKDGIEYRLEGCHEGCTPEHFEKDCPRLVLVPVVRYVADHMTEIQGFAPFLIDNVSIGSGNECFVKGTYIPGLVVEGIMDDSMEVNPYGTYARKMVE